MFNGAQIKPCRSDEIFSGSFSWLLRRVLGAHVDENQDNNRGAVRVDSYEEQVNMTNMDRAAGLVNARVVPLACLFAAADDLVELILKVSKLDDAARADVIDQVRRRSE